MSIPDGIIIRSMTEDDIAAVGDLTAAAYLPFEQDNLFYLDILRDARPRWVQSTETLVACSSQGDNAGEVLGAVSLATAESPLQDIAQPGEIEIRMLAVAPAHQNRGIGRALVLACQDYARRHHYHTIVLSSQFNMTCAHHLYEDLGFTPVPERYWEPLVGMKVMVWAWTIPSDTPAT